MNRNKLSAAEGTGVEQFHVAQYTKYIFIAPSEA
jgi:hypothetical protein